MLPNTRLRYHFRKIGLAVSLLLAAGGFSPASCQERTISIEHFSIEKGLSNLNTTCIIQHSDHFIYVGTRDGLNRFDGYEFLSLSLSPEVEARQGQIWVLDLLELSGGRLLVRYSHVSPTGQYEMGTEVYNPTSGISTAMHPESRGFMGIYSGHAIVEDRQYFYGADTAFAYIHSIDDSLFFDLAFKIPHGRKVDQDLFDELKGDPRWPVQFDMEKVPVPVEGGQGFLIFDEINGLRRLDHRGQVKNSFFEDEFEYQRSRGESPFIVRKGALDKLSDGSIFFTITFRGLPGKRFRYQARDDRFVELSEKNEWDFSTNWHFDDFGNEFRYREHNAGGKSRTSIILRTGETLDLSRLVPNLNPGAPVYGEDLSRLFYILTLRGMVKLSLRRSPFKTYLADELRDWEYNISCRAITALNQDCLLLSAERAGLFLLDKQTDSISPLVFTGTSGSDTLTIEHIWGAYPGDAGIAWVTRVSGEVLELDLKAGEATPHKSPIEAFGYATTQLRNGKILWGGNRYSNSKNVLQTFDPDTRQFEIAEIKNGDYLFDLAIPSFFLERPNGQIWMGSKSGLFLIDPDKSMIVAGFFPGEMETGDSDPRFEIHKNLSAGHIMCLYEDPSGLLWIGTEGGGINIMDIPESSVEILTTEDGLSNNSVCGIIRDSSGYWLSTYHGLSYYNSETGLFRNYYKDNGLSDNELNRASYFRDSGGMIYLGSMNGFNRFHPDALLKEDRPAPVNISQVAYFKPGGEAPTVHHFGWAPDKSLVIPSGKRSLSVRVALADYESPGANTFFYALQPIQSVFGTNTPEWKSVGTQREIEFSNLPSGRYNLSIRATSSQGVPSSNQVHMRLHIREYFYKTGWFVLLIITIVGGILYALHRYRLAQAIRMERLRARISSDLHDELGGVLSGIAYQMESLENQVPHPQRSLIERIKVASRDAMFKMRDVIWAIDSRKDTVNDLEDRMREFADELLTPLGIELEIESLNFSSGQQLPSDIRHHVLLIFKEFLTNSVKHARASRIVVNLNRKGKTLHVSFKDNGVGNINPGTTTGMGLENIRMRADKIQAKCTFETDNGFGLHVTVKAF